jgi:pimeloyl-ACP methyl ester carboxylesterase
MPSPITESTIQTNGIRLHVVQAGPPGAPLVVLLHGFPEFWRGWQRQVAPLAAAGFRVAVPDQRGYNLSDAPKAVAAYRLEELGKDITGLLDALGYPACYLAGHDWGAAVAWYLALAYPQRVKKLAIHNVPHPAVMLDYLKRHPAQMLKSWYIAFFQIPGLADWLVSRDGFRLAAAALQRTSRPGTFSGAEIAEYKQAWANSGGLSGMINWYRALARYRPAMPVDRRVRMPTLVQWGQRDAFLSYAMAEESLKLCDAGRLVAYPHASHWVQHEEAEAVSRALVEFFGDPGRA